MAGVDQAADVTAAAAEQDDKMARWMAIDIGMHNLTAAIYCFGQAGCDELVTKLFDVKQQALRERERV